MEEEMFLKTLGRVNSFRDFQIKKGRSSFDFAQDDQPLISNFKSQ
jgi:hypothetical protein